MVSITWCEAFVQSLTHTVVSPRCCIRLHLEVNWFDFTFAQRGSPISVFAGHCGKRLKSIFSAGSCFRNAWHDFKTLGSLTWIPNAIKRHGCICHLAVMCNHLLICVVQMKVFKKLNYTTGCEISCYACKRWRWGDGDLPLFVLYHTEGLLTHGRQADAGALSL